MILIVADSMMRIGIEVQDAVYSVGCMGVADGGSRVPSIAWHPGEHWCPHGYVYLIPSDHVPSGDKGGPAGLFRVSLRWSIPWACKKTTDQEPEEAKTGDDFCSHQGDRSIRMQITTGGLNCVTSLLRDIPY